MKKIRPNLVLETRANCYSQLVRLREVSISFGKFCGGSSTEFDEAVFMCEKICLCSYGTWLKT